VPALWNIFSSGCLESSRIVFLTKFRLKYYFVRFAAMRIHINRVPEGHSVLSQEVTALGEKAPESVAGTIVSCIADIDRLHSQAHVRVRFKCVAKLQCSRCLARVELPIAGEYRVVMQERTRQQSKNLLPEDEVDILFDESTDEIDLAPFTYDEILLAIPMKPLCSEGCKGIILAGDPAISVEYEEGHRNTIDPRWEALARLKNKGSR
jgi:uncharacterized protein